jgi:hypothetical protein
MGTSLFLVFVDFLGGDVIVGRMVDESESLEDATADTF